MHSDTSFSKAQVGNVTGGTAAELFEDESEKSKEPGLLEVRTWQIKKKNTAAIDTNKNNKIM